MAHYIRVVGVADSLSSLLPTKLKFKLKLCLLAYIDFQAARVARLVEMCGKKVLFIKIILGFLKNIWIEFGVWTGENLRHLHKLSRDIQSYCIIYNKTPYKLQHKYIPVFFPHNFYTKQRAQSDRRIFIKSFQLKLQIVKLRLLKLFEFNYCKKLNQS